jgi:hypothetical protein
MPAKKDNLSILIPDASVETSIGTFLLRPFRFKDSKTALGLIKHYASILFDDVEDKDADGETFKRAKTTAEIINCVLEEEGEDYPVLEDIAKLLKLACNTLDPDKVGELGYDDVFLLLAEIIQQNRDFFQRLMNKINPPKEDKEAKPIQKTMVLESAA